MSTRKKTLTANEPSELLAALTAVLQEQTLTTDDKVVEVCSLVDEWRDIVKAQSSEAEVAFYYERVDALHQERAEVEAELRLLREQNEKVANPMSPIVIRNNARVRELELKYTALMTELKHCTRKLECK